MLWGSILDMRCTEITFPKNYHWPATGCVLVTWIMVILSGVSAADPTSPPTRIEVFTTTDQEVVGASAIGPKQQYSDIELQIHRLDGIQQVESGLSGNLPSDLELAKRVALQRIQQLDEQESAAIQNAAVGLAKAMQYGIDRYPAIVFNSQIVVYGVTDLKVALDHYRTWQVGARP